MGTRQLRSRCIARANGETELRSERQDLPNMAGINEKAMGRGVNARVGSGGRGFRHQARAQGESHAAVVDAAAIDEDLRVKDWMQQVLEHVEIPPGQEVPLGGEAGKQKPKWSVARYTSLFDSTRLESPLEVSPPDVPIQDNPGNLASSGETTSDGEDSESEDHLDAQEISEDDLPAPGPAPALRKQSRQGKALPTQKSKELSSDKLARQLVDDDHVSRLVRYYRKHLATFSKGRKKKIKQLIPNKVWLEVYADYKKDFPASVFQKESLKEHLRTALKEMSSGVNHPKGGDGAEPPDEEIMQKLMETEGAKTQNVLRTRNGAFQQTSASSGQATSQSDTVSNQQDPHQSGEPRLVPSGKPPTKSQQLKMAGDNISEMLSEFKGMKEEFQGGNPGGNPGKRKLDEAKVDILRDKQIFQAKQNVLAEIQLLKEQRALELITNEEFKEKCKIAFGM